MGTEAEASPSFTPKRHTPTEIDARKFMALVVFPFKAVSDEADPNGTDNKNHYNRTRGGERGQESNACWKTLNSNTSFTVPEKSIHAKVRAES